MKKVLLVVNPSAGGEQAENFKQQVEAKLAEHFDEVLVRETEGAGDACRFAREAAENEFDSVFVMGGDGTVNEGISGLAEADHRPKFGFFPLGTVNDLARALKMPLDPEEAIRQLDLSNTGSLDIAKVNDDYFMNVVAIGSIPESINSVDPEEKTKFGKLAYFISGIKQLKDGQTYRFKLTIDGQEMECETSTILIGLTNSIGGFEQLLPQAKVDDGKLHLIYLKDSNFLETLKALPSLLTGVEKSDQSLFYQAFEKVEIELLDERAELYINSDGDQGDPLPVAISILPSHLTVYRYD